MRLALLAAVLTVCAFAAPAPAATVSVLHVEVEPCKSCADYDLIRFVAGDGERNDVAVSQRPLGVVVFEDAGAPLRAGDGCTAEQGGVVACRALGLRRTELALGDGDDRLDARAPLRADGGPGADRLGGGVAPGEFTPTLEGGPGDDVLSGGGALIGGTGADRLVGGAGDNSLLQGDPPEGPFSADVIEGGGGTDSVSYEARTSPVTVDLASPGGQGAPGEGDVITGVENVVGSDAPDVLRGDDGPNRLDAERLAPPPGTGRGDVLDGRGGDDLLWGGRLDDALDGGAGDDEVVGNGGRDRLAGAGGGDRLRPGSFSDPGDRMACGAGRDSVVRPDVRDVVTRDCEAADLGSNDLQGGPPRRARGGYLVPLLRTVRDSPPACRVVVRVVGSRATRVSEGARIARYGRRTVRASRPAARPRGVPAPPPGFVRVVAESRDCDASPARPIGYTIALG